MRHVTRGFILLLFATACSPPPPEVNRPIEPWAFRSVLDKKPRMLTLALDSSMYVAYDLRAAAIYDVWKGGVLMEGAAYTDKKNVQPSRWGTSYLNDSTKFSRWVVEADGQAVTPQFIHKGHRFEGGRVWIRYALALPSRDTVVIEESPEFKRSGDGAPGLERIFRMGSVPPGTTVALHSRFAALKLKPGSDTHQWLTFNPLPRQFPPDPEAAFDHRGRYWMDKSDCFTCHETHNRMVGPSFLEIAERYSRDKATLEYLTRRIQEGGSGVWGSAMMNPHPDLSDLEIREMLSFVFTLKPTEKKGKGVATPTSLTVPPPVKKRPGHGAPLEGVHPSFDLHDLRPHHFKPRVGGLAFMPDGRMVVTTWDTMGGVYLLDGVTTGDTTQITVKKIAQGLAEPLGVEVVDGDIYVLQKHELTRLIDHDGDEVIDEYETICDSWGATTDFHEFAFGLAYKDGYFYAALSMAMRLMSNEEQHPDRGRAIRISRKNGSFTSINYGLRTPNGVGWGVDSALFVTDNQGQWLPANKLIHVKEGEYLGMRWGIPRNAPTLPVESPPAIWLPQDEIGNSPSEPVLIPFGPYKGQMLHGDVTHGGIKRDFVEKVGGHYQGAVFRFSQGFEAGVNRMRWGPDSALYLGGVGMVGGWSWKEKQYGLQKIKFNGKTTFEMLAVRAMPDGFEIELTEPLASDYVVNADSFRIEQWRYEPTAAYGGPKLDHKRLAIRSIERTDNDRKLRLVIDGLRERHVVYVALPSDFRSVSGQSLWSNEAWYTLNTLPSATDFKP